MDLQSQYQNIKIEVNEAIQKVLDTSAYVLGPDVKEFEKDFASAHSAKHGIAVNTGTSALHLALLAAGIGPGDEVITVSMTFAATTASILYVGATPVFVDVDPVSCNMEPSLIESKITSKTKAIMPVHLYGQAADMDPILDIALRHGLTIIEDSAQAHLARYKDKSVGSIGDFAAFSFYPGKNLGAYGEGGLVMTNNDEMASKLNLLRDWGQTKKYHHEMLAYNYRMDGIQGAILRVKLKYLDSWTEQRRARAEIYRELLIDSDFQLPEEVKGNRHVYHIFSIFHPKRDRLMIHLQENGIQCGLHYPIPTHLQKAYEFLGYKAGDLPNTERLAAEQLSLPMYPEMPLDDLELVAKELLKFK